jgi:two-component system, LytTR family, response regulator
MMKICLIDDERNACAALHSLLQMEIPDAKIEEASSVASGLALIRNQKPDIVFLDVMMKDGTGFDLLQQLPKIDFKLVIVSGHDEFALKAFRFSAIDYLLKPVDRDELRATLSRIRTLDHQPWQQIIDVLKQSIHPIQEAERKIVLKDMQTVYVVSVSSIIRCEASDNYTTFHLAGQNPITVSRPLKEYDELLSVSKFIRVHQSHLINLNQLQQFNKREGGSVTMKDGSEVPVSTRNRENLIHQLSQFS